MDILKLLHSRKCSRPCRQTIWKIKFRSLFLTNGHFEGEREGGSFCVKGLNGGCKKEGKRVGEEGDVGHVRVLGRVKEILPTLLSADERSKGLLREAERRGAARIRERGGKKERKKERRRAQREGWLAERVSWMGAVCVCFPRLRSLGTRDSSPGP